MPRAKKQENLKKKEEIKEKNQKISYKKPSPKEDTNFFKNVVIFGAISLIFSLIIQLAFNQNSQEVDITLTENDYKLAHRDFQKYKNEVLHENPDPEFSENIQISEKIIDYYEKWIHVDLHPKIHYDTGMQFQTGHLGLKNDFDYCKKSDLWKLLHPESIYENYYMLTDFAPQELPRQIARDFGYDVHPDLYMGMNPRINNQRLYDINQKTALINSRISRFHHFHHFGKCLFCAFQSSNHIPGKWSITGKDLVINNLRTYEKSKFQNPEECKKTIEFMPPSYRLFDRQECVQFFNYLDSEEYKQKIEKNHIGFILKHGRDIHRGEGIEVVTKDKENELRRTYQNGKACGKVKETVQAQTYIANPMLYKKHKIEVRIYFLIASTNPLIIYSQNLAHLRMCAEEFDKFSDQKEVHVCNVAVAKKQGDPNYIVDFSLDGLRDYLLEEGIITNKNWIEEDIYPQIYRAITHISRLGEHDFLKDSRVNENFALDFLLDDNSKIWFMENNPNPQILKISNKRVYRHYIMFGDMFDIQFSYLRSRFKRLQNLAKEMKEALKNGTFKEEIFKQKFIQSNKNRLEPEFEINPKNSYHKIYDESLEGDDIFCGNLPSACHIKK